MTVPSRGFTLSATLASLESVNAGLPPKSRVTSDSLHKHSTRHFNMQAPAGAIWRRIQEQRTAESGADYESGIISLVNAASYLETMMLKGYETLVGESTVVSVDQGARAAKQLHELTRQDAGVERMAQLQIQMGRIAKVMKDIIPPKYHQAILDVLDAKEIAPVKEIEGSDKTEQYDPLSDAEVDEEGEGEFDPADDEEDL